MLSGRLVNLKYGSVCTEEPGLAGERNPVTYDQLTERSGKLALSVSTVMDKTNVREYLLIIDGAVGWTIGGNIDWNP